MKKNYTKIIVFLFGLANSFAQPVLNESDFSSYYESDQYSQSDVLSLSAGNSGANQTWDFSGLTTLTLVGNFSIIPYNTSPHATTFPTANVVSKSITTEPSNPYYSYFKNSASTFESVGGADNNNTDKETDNAIIFQYPYTYNTIINDTYQDEGDPTVYSFTSTYDAFGTLITPYGTHTNVIRQKTVEVDGDETYTDYIWFSTNPFRLLMDIGFTTSSSSSNNYISIYSNFSPLSTKEYNKEPIVKIYPNPTTDILNIQLANNSTVDKVKITDMSGKTVIENTKNVKQINVEKLNKGVYLISVYSGQEKFDTKFVKE
jgi:hypothetical protein